MKKVPQPEIELDGEVGVLRGEIKGQEAFGGITREGQQSGARLWDVRKGAGVVATVGADSLTFSRRLDAGQSQHLGQLRKREVFRQDRSNLGRNNGDEFIKQNTDIGGFSQALIEAEGTAAELEVIHDRLERRGPSVGHHHDSSRRFGGFRFVGRGGVGDCLLNL